MIDKHIVTLLVHAFESDRKTIVPGDFVRLRRDRTTLGMVIEVMHESLTISHSDPPEVLKIAVARVLWSLVSQMGWTTFTPMPVPRYFEPSYVVTSANPTQRTQWMRVSTSFVSRKKVP
jgi:hypothetical protein